MISGSNEGIRKKELPLFALLLLLTCLLIYHPKPTMGFVLDGHYVVRENPLIKNLELYGKIWTTEFFTAYKASQEFRFQYYRPLVTASYIPDYQLWGQNAAGYRFTNILIHFFNALLVYGLIVLLLEHRRAAMLGAFLFAVLPVQEWVVNYVVGRGDLLQTFLSLMSLIVLIYYLRSGNVRWMVTSKLFFIAALLCREAAILFPVYAGLVIWFQSGKAKKVARLIMPYLGISLIYFMVRYFYFPIAVGEGTVFSLAGMGKGLILAVDFSTRFFLPWSVSHSLGLMSSPLVQAGLAAAGLIGAAVILRIFSEKHNRRIWILSVLWMAAGMSPFFAAGSMAERLGPYLSEHFLYFSSVGFVMLLSWILVSMQSSRVRNIAVAAVVAACVAVGVFNNTFWTSEEVVLRRVSETEPGLWTAAARQLLMVYDKDPDAVLSMAHSVQAPAQKSLWLRRAGYLYRSRGEPVQAEDYFQKALSANPANLDALNGLAVVYLETGHWDEGIALLRRSRELDGAYPETHRLFGEALYRRGEFREAIASFEQARRYDPDSGAVALHLAMAHFFLDEGLEYERYLDAAFQLIEMPDVLLFVAGELFDKNYFAKVIELLERNPHFLESSPRLAELLRQARLSFSSGSD